jgi:hypothetical protein
MRFNEYFELSEKHAWKTRDLDWDALRREQDAGLVDDFDRQALLGTAVIESGVPHYGDVWGLVHDLRAHWDLWQFTLLWTGEEHRHGFALEKAATVLGLEQQIASDLERVRAFPFAESQKAVCQSGCYRTVPGMLTYTVIQELITNRFYTYAAKHTRSPFMRELFSLIGGDEMRHHVFFRDALRELHATTSDAEAYGEQVYQAVRSFKMPHRIYGLQVEFFDGGPWAAATDATRMQLARCFDFDMRIVGRLARDLAEKAARKAERLVARAS